MPTFTVPTGAFAMLVPMHMGVPPANYLGPNIWQDICSIWLTLNFRSLLLGTVNSLTGLCSRENTAKSSHLLSRCNDLRAAKLFNLVTCLSIVSHGEQALVHYCSSVTAQVDAKLAPCGYERIISETFTVGTNGYLPYKFTLPLHTNGYAQIRDATFEYNATAKEWLITHTSVQVSHTHLAAIINSEANKSLLEGLTHQDALPQQLRFTS